jgi:small-conductance mechanosensitive channel
MPINKEQLEAISETVLHAMPAILMIIVGALLINMILGRILNILAHKTNFTRQEIEPARSLVFWIVYLAALVLIIQSLGLNISGMWTVLSTLFAMVAIGFVAMWSVLSNTLCTLIILIFRPFAMGDEIEFPGEAVKGRVTDINFIYTTLEVEASVTMQIPNNLFFQKVLKRRHNAIPVSLAAQLRSKAAYRSEAETQSVAQNGKPNEKCSVPIGSPGRR